VSRARFTRLSKAKVVSFTVFDCDWDTLPLAQKTRLMRSPADAPPKAWSPRALELLTKNVKTGTMARVGRENDPPDFCGRHTAISVGTQCLAEKGARLMDVFDKCYQFTDARAAQEVGLYPFFVPLSQSEGSVAYVGDHRILMCGANNYLGLTTHPKVRQAAIDAIKEFGTSCTGSRLANGTLEIHRELEGRLADFVGKERALVFSTGYQVNLGVISALVCKGDYVITDKEDHASIVDGCLLSRGAMRRFRHNDMIDLDRVLSTLPQDVGKLVAVDGLFSVTGDVAPLPDIIALCKQHNSRLLVDDAHAMGVLGGGRGTSAYFGVTDDVDLIMGTFSKSFASMGGFIAADEDVIHFIQHHARAFIFSAALTPPNVAAVAAALDVMIDEPERIERLNRIGDRMRKAYTELGFDIGPSQSPIIPVIIGEEFRALLVWKRLYEEGLYTNLFIPPGVPENRSLLRTSYMATHTDEQLDEVLDIMERVGKEARLIS
jgi:8-amino-7-oxononanoate synthase